MSAFDRPIGAQIDVNELEYISFLHQTTIGPVRTDCSITAEDIQTYLMSRYGIEVDRAVVQGTILQGLGGGNSSSDVIDLMELAAVLLIPVLVKAAAVEKGVAHLAPIRTDADSTCPTVRVANTTSYEEAPASNSNPNDLDKTSITYKLQSAWTYLADGVRNLTGKNAGIAEPDDEDDAAAANAAAAAYLENVKNGALLSSQMDNLFKFVARMILHDTTSDSQPKPLTVELIKEILMLYGEHEIARDDKLIMEMIQAAIPPEDHGQEELVFFDGRTFAIGATYDLELYDLTNEEKRSTLYDDVFPPQVALLNHAQHHNSNDEDDSNSPEHRNNGNANDGDEHGTEKFSPERVFTAPAIDVTAGTYRSKALTVMLWSTAILHFCSYYMSRSSKLFQAEYCKEAGLEYNTTLAALQKPWIANSGAIACETGMSIIEWLVVFLYIGAYGLTFTSVGSIGNTIECYVWYHPIVGCLPVLVSIIVYIVARENHLSYILVLTICGIFLSLLVLYMHLTHSLAIILSEDHLRRHPGIREYWLSEETIEKLRTTLKPRMTEAELLNKRAMTQKLTAMTENAVYIFSKMERGTADVIDTFYGRAVHAFAQRGIRDTIPNTATFNWTWSNIWNKHLFDQEGIVFSVRVLASNIGQLTATFFVLWAGISLLQYTILNFGDHDQVKGYANSLLLQQMQKNNSDLLVSNISSLFGTHMLELQQSGDIQINCSDYTSKYTDTYKFCKTDGLTGVETCENTTQIDSLCALSASQSLTIQEQLHLLEQSGFDTNQMTSISELAIEAAVNDAIETLYPTQIFMLTVPVGVGIFFACLTAITLTATYLPSVASTILQLRSGLIPLMRGKDNQRLREAPETVALLTGSIFWGCLAASVLNGALIGLLLFLCLWQVSVFYMQRFLAIVVGLLSVTIFKLLFLLCFRRKAYGGFYRKQPLLANIGVLTLEWANFTLSAGIIIARGIKLMLVTFFSIGRVNRPFLAPGIGQFGPIELDGYPTIHLRELLAHEAHRHPYIELLGYVYLMKLRYSDEFGKTAGSCWRLIFVHALMPWLRQYRIGNRSEASLMFNANEDMGWRDVRRVNNTTRTMAPSLQQKTNSKRFENVPIESSQEIALSQYNNSVSRRLLTRNVSSDPSLGQEV